MEQEEKRPGLTIAVIPARGGSKAVPGKNLRIIKGSPLIAHTIRSARRSGLIDKIVVSSDDDEILAVSRANGAIAIKRPEELATDEAPTEPALEHTVKTLEDQGDEIRLVILLQCTSPLRDEHDIVDALIQMESTNADSLLSVCSTHAFFWTKDILTGEAIAQYDYKNRPRRQDLTLDDKVYRENGAIYITKRDILMSQHNRLGGKITLYVMPEHLSMEIDSEFDLWLAEELMTQRPVFRDE
jgi:CMP-N,N'-diacetyllegionaminic acid synthase